MTTQILNFGLPAPVDVQIEGQDLQANREVADNVLSQLRHVAGLTDLRIQQEFDYPRFNVDCGSNQGRPGRLHGPRRHNSLLVALSGSFQTAPTFFLNWQNGVQYELIAQTPQYRIQSLQDVGNIPISSPTMIRPEILSKVASISRGSEMEVLSHYNIRRVVDIYGSVQDRDLGAVGRDVTRIVNQNQKLLPRGSFFRIRGQLETMRTSYEGLLAGLGFAIVLVYFLIVVNFQSWLDPVHHHHGAAGRVGGHYRFPVSHPHYAQRARAHGRDHVHGRRHREQHSRGRICHRAPSSHGDALEAAIEAGFTRFRPVLMTALAMIIGMIPMALGLGDGGEQNAPLGRAVVGGLLCATVATLVFVPTVFALLHGSGAGMRRAGHGKRRIRTMTAEKLMAADENDRKAAAADWLSG